MESDLGSRILTTMAVQTHVVIVHRPERENVTLVLPGFLKDLLRHVCSAGSTLKTVEEQPAVGITLGFGLLLAAEVQSQQLSDTSWLQWSLKDRCHSETTMVNNRRYYMIPTTSADGSNTCVQSPKISQLKLAQEHGVGGDEEHNIIKKGWYKNVGYPIWYGSS
jgi:hypothetical protein